MFYLGIDRYAKQLKLSLLNAILKRQVSTQPERRVGITNGSRTRA